MKIGNNRNVLLVEDEGPVRRLISKFLQMHDFNVLEATQGEEALAVSESFPGTIHLLVTDIMMPVMNGHELANRLANLRPHLSVLFISGYPGKHLPEGLESMATMDYLPKPFKFDVLMAKIALLARPADPEPPA
jgi:two-component system, cell cycle sensor histidine kinase and response regulator CckA